MAAPTNAAKREESSCQLGAVHTWHKADVIVALLDVRFWGRVQPVSVLAFRSMMVRPRPQSQTHHD
jgi:hypothetical protein